DAAKRHERELFFSVVTLPVIALRAIGRTQGSPLPHKNQKRSGDTMNLTLKRAPQPAIRDETAAVTVHDLTVAYRETPVLWDLDRTIPTGTLTAIIGPNGAGKSTLLKSILGLVPVASGSIEIFGHSSPRQRQLVGYVPQRG